MRSELQRGREILRAEGDALHVAADTLDDQFTELVDVILALEGKVVMTGVGKSGIIGQKIAATLSSTGTPALFVHSVEAVMGDLGILSRKDLLVAISNSGETNEVVNVVLAAAEIGTPGVAITRNPESSLARACKHVLPLKVSREAGHLGLAPTSSAAVTLGLGDALALVLAEARAFTAEDFARFHPGGTLGRRLALRVSDLMRTGDDIPVITDSTTVPEALLEITRGTLGSTLVVNGEGALVGIFTDGDLRRLMEGGRQPDLSRTVREVMSKDPDTVESDALASEALRIMEVRGITLLPIVDSQSRPAGVIHIHDVLGRAKFMV